jgi:hypothetical protein
MGVREAIRKADALLPGVPVKVGTDPRWQAIIAVQDYIKSEPEAVWTFIHRWGGHSQEDLRDAVASCLLEHLLEVHFEAYFPQVERLALSDSLFGDTFLRCWQFGQAEESENAARFEALKTRLRAAESG